jgi:cell division protein FtsL
VKPLLLFNLVLAAGVAASAVAVVYVKHEARRVFSESQELVRERDRLNVEWSMLQLEEAAWSTHGRIERLARERLNMRLPSRADIVIIKP